MKTGDIVLIPFPFAELTNKKVRPAVVICAISSVVPSQLSKNEMKLPSNEITGLRVPSILKMDRIVTAKREDVIA